MTMLTHAGSPCLPQSRHEASHAATIKRLGKSAVTIALLALVVTGVIGLRVVAWFPPLSH